VDKQRRSQLHHIGRSVRLDTLIRLRWLAVVGQTAAVLIVYWGLDFELPVWACLSVIALAAWLNVALRIRFPSMQRLEPRRAAWLLAFDIAELAVLLFFTGGLQNPFSFLFLGPVLISATALPSRMTLMLGGFAIACSTRFGVTTTIQTRAPSMRTSSTCGKSWNQTPRSRVSSSPCMAVVTNS